MRRVKIVPVPRPPTSPPKEGTRKRRPSPPLTEEQKERKRVKERERDRARKNEFNLEERVAQVKKDASKNERKLTLSDDDIRSIVVRSCIYCGSPSYYGNWRTNGIDRVDNSVGYMEGNCVPCCKTCNYLKGKMFVDHFLQKALDIAAYQKEKPFVAPQQPPNLFLLFLRESSGSE